jgi:chromosomal replication initiator protein
MNAVEAGDMNNFRFKFRNADMLLVDDIHFFAGRDRTQEEFFHTFNTLQQSGKQIVLSADAPPNEIPELEDRLVSRFNWGLVAPVERPCYETRVAILRKKAKMRALDMQDDAICYIAARVERNTRELEGAITKIQGISQLSGRNIDLQLVREALGDNGEADADRRVTIQHILDAVTGYYGVKVSDLQSKRRNKSIAFPRQVCMYLARHHTKYSLDEIGGYFGGRDHTTVLHGVRKITQQVSSDNDVQRQVTSLVNQISGRA